MSSSKCSIGIFLNDACNKLAWTKNTVILECTLNMIFLKLILN